MSSVEEAIKLNDNKELMPFEEKYYGFLMARDQQAFKPEAGRGIHEMIRVTLLR